MRATRWMRCSTTQIGKCTRTRRDKAPQFHNRISQAHSALAFVGAQRGRIFRRHLLICKFLDLPPNEVLRSFQSRIVQPESEISRGLLKCRMTRANQSWLAFA